MLRIFRGERRSAPTAKSTDEAGADAHQPPDSPEAVPASAAGVDVDGSGRDGASAAGDGEPVTEDRAVTEQRAGAAPADAEQATDEHQAAPPPGEITPSAPWAAAPAGGEDAPPQDGAPAQGAAAGQAPAEDLPGDPGFLQRGRMRRRARFLRAARELAYRDLGGLVFDLQRFGARNDEVVGAKLATLGRIDAELRAIEEALRLRSPVTVLREAGVAACPRCAAIHGSDDRFCPACGLAVAQAERPIGGAAASQAPVPPPQAAVPQQAPLHYQAPAALPHSPAQQLAPSQYQQPYVPQVSQSPYRAPVAAPPMQAPPTAGEQSPPTAGGQSPPLAGGPGDLRGDASAVQAGLPPHGGPPERGAFPGLPAAPAAHTLQPDGQRQAAGEEPSATTSGRAPEETPTQVVSPGEADDVEQRTRALDPVPFGAHHDADQQRRR